MTLSPEQISSIVAILIGIFTLGVAAYKELSKYEQDKEKATKYSNQYEGECWSLVRHLSQTIREQHQDLLMLREANSHLAKQLTKRN